MQRREGPQHRHSAGICLGAGQTPPRLTQLSSSDSQLRPAGPPSSPLAAGGPAGQSLPPMSSSSVRGASAVSSQALCVSRKYFSKCSISRPLHDWKHFPLIGSGGSVGSC